MDAATNNGLLNVVDVLYELTTQVKHLPIKGVDVAHVHQQLGRIRRELIETELSD